MNTHENDSPDPIADILAGVGRGGPLLDAALRGDLDAFERMERATLLSSRTPWLAARPTLPTRQHDYLAGVALNGAAQALAHLPRLAPNQPLSLTDAALAYAGVGLAGGWLNAALRNLGTEHPAPNATHRSPRVRTVHAMAHAITELTSTATLPIGPARQLTAAATTSLDLYTAALDNAAGGGRRAA